MKPELVVFGTSPLVSAELHTAIRRLFGDTYPVREALTEDAAREDPEKDACWIGHPSSTRTFPVSFPRKRPSFSICSPPRNSSSP